MMQTDQLIAQLAGEPAPKAAASPWRLSLRWLAFLTFYAAMVMAFSSARPDLLTALQQPFFALEILLLAGIVISAVLSAALMSFPDLHQKRLLTFVPIFFFAAFAGVMVAALLADPSSSREAGKGMQCLSCISAYAVLPALLLLRAIARMATTRGASAGMLALLCAFAVGALLIRLREPTESIMHVMVWHYAPMLVVALIGLVLGRRLLRW
ncbi:MAG: NrsF family protein [Rickettsiales bacterium]